MVPHPSNKNPPENEVKVEDKLADDNKGVETPNKEEEVSNKEEEIPNAEVETPNIEEETPNKEEETPNKDVETLNEEEQIKKNQLNKYEPAPNFESEAADPEVVASKAGKKDVSGEASVPATGRKKGKRRVFSLISGI